VGHARDVLLDDRAGVELLGHVVRGGADDLHPALVGARVGIGAREGRQERVVDVDDRRAHRPQERRREDLHVAGEHDQVELARQRVEQLRLGLGLGVTGDRDVPERDVEARRLALQLAVVGDDQRDLRVQLAAPVAPQQLGQAVVVARDEDRHPLAMLGVLEPPAAGPEPGAHLLGELRLERVGRLLQPVELELQPHEELAAVGVGGVLVGLEDVAAAVAQERRDLGDDPRPVRAGDEQPPDASHCRRSIIARRQRSVRSSSLNV
jgi:hypothetical protein